MHMEEYDGFHLDGYSELHSIHEPQVWTEIELKYAPELDGASWFNRRKIRKRMEREIASRLDELAPPDALY